MTPDGRASVAFNRPRARYGRTEWAANLATLGLAGGPVTTHSAGGEVAAAFGVTTVLLDDGTPALVWSETLLRAGERVRLAAENVEAREPALPRLTVGRPAERAIDGATRLHLPLACSSRCEVSATLTGASSGSGSYEAKAAGKGTLIVYAVARGKAAAHGKLRLRVAYRARNGSKVGVRIVHFTASVSPLKPVVQPRVSGLRAVRRGASIRVTWRTSRDIDPDAATFSVIGTTTRSRFEEPLVTTYGEGPGGQIAGRTFSATIKPATGVNWVTLYSTGAQPLKRVVRVR